MDAGSGLNVVLVVSSVVLVVKAIILSVWDIASVDVPSSWFVTRVILVASFVTFLIVSTDTEADVVCCDTSSFVDDVGLLPSQLYCALSANSIYTQLGKLQYY